MVSRMMLMVWLGAMLVVCSNVRAQHLWWNLEGQKATCLYGEVTVLATHPAVYFCGANWHPGEPAGGYCGIQHNSMEERRTIFSIWDTTPELHPRITEADAATILSRFGGEGTGAHTHMLWNWKQGETFQFFVRKQAGISPDTTDTRYYLFDLRQKKWVHSATISSPNGGKKSVPTIGGGLNSFLENFGGKDAAVPKLALYRLWLGSDLEKMKCLTRAKGDGTWGQMLGAYFLAEGEAAQLKTVFGTLEKDYGKPAFGSQGDDLKPIADSPVPAEVIEALKNPPQAKPVKDQ